MKKANNKKIYIIISIIILIIILIALLICIMKIRIINNDTINEGVLNVEIPGINNVYPNGTTILSKNYKGNFSMNEISTQISKFMLYAIPTLKKISTNINNVDNYYEKNYTTIENLCGKISLDEFEGLIDLVKEIESNELNYKTSKYINDESLNLQMVYEVPLQIFYEEDSVEVLVIIDSVEKTIKCINKD